MSRAQQVAFDFIASGKTWEQYSIDTFGESRPAPLRATYNALLSRGLIKVGPHGDYTIA